MKIVKKHRNRAKQKEETMLRRPLMPLLKAQELYGKEKTTF